MATRRAGARVAPARRDVPSRATRRARATRAPAAALEFATPCATLAAAALGRACATRVALGRAATAPVCAMAVGAAFAALGALPSDGGEGLAAAQRACACVATPMTTLRANARATATRRDARRVGVAFAIAALGTVVGAMVGAWGTRVAFDAAFDWRLAAALAAKNVGGGLNYVAVATTLGMDGDAFVAGLCVDNAMALVYFPFISWLARRGGDGDDAVDDARVDGDEDEDEDEDARGDDALSACVFAVGALAAGERIARWIGYPTAVLPIATALTVAFATAAPKRAAALADVAEPLAAAPLFVFFVIAGASGGVLSASTFARYADVFVFSCALYAVHLAFVLVAVRVDPRRRREIVLASNASVGGPATVAALADAVGWRALRAPAVLVATFGNAIATFVGLGVAWCLRAVA